MTTGFSKLLCSGLGICLQSLQSLSSVILRVSPCLLLQLLSATTFRCKILQLRHPLHKYQNQNEHSEIQLDSTTQLLKLPCTTALCSSQSLAKAAQSSCRRTTSGAIASRSQRLQCQFVSFHTCSYHMCVNCSVCTCCMICCLCRIAHVHMVVKQDQRGT